MGFLRRSEKKKLGDVRRIGTKEELCVLGVCDASYHNDEKSKYHPTQHFQSTDFVLAFR